MSQRDRTTGCICNEGAAGYRCNPSCPAATGIPLCEDCGYSGHGRCRCPEPPPPPVRLPGDPEPKFTRPRPDPWA